MRPTLHTDAYEDETARHVPIIFLAGPIKHWWTCWGSPEHEEYVAHRDAVRALLIEHGYLTYAAWDAIKGSWDERAQAINNAAILASDLVLVLTPPFTPAEGTDAEVLFAQASDIPVLRFMPGVPGYTECVLLDALRFYVGRGVQYS